MQKVHKCCIEMCNQCKSLFDKPCAWLSLGNEYCDEIMNIEQVISGLETENKKLWERHYEEYNQISKAIEYIEDNSTNTYLLKSFDIDMLLEILKGEDKE